MDSDLTLTIGNITRRYVLRVTNAPKRYDAGTTLTVADEAQGQRTGITGRLVAIERSMLEYHAGRYGSGLFVCDLPDDLGHEWLLASVTDALWQRLFESKD